MSSPELDTYLILGFATGLSSFFLALLLSQSFGTALFVGAIAIPASFAGGWLGLRWHIISSKQYRNSLYHQIRNYERKENQVYDDLQEQLQTHQKLEASINSFSIQQSQLQNHLNCLLNQRNKLQYEIENISNYKEKQDLYYAKLQDNLQKLRQKEAHCQKILESKNSFIQQKELRVRYLQSELDSKLNKKKALELEILNLEQQKAHLGGGAYDLNTQINVLSAKQDEREIELLSLQLQKQQYTTEVEVQQPQKIELYSEYLSREIEETAKETREDWQEWLDLVEQFSDEEMSALKAILAGDKKQFKSIADLQCVMPQVLVEAINQKALISLGDTLLTANSCKILPEIHQSYYQALVNALAKTK